MYISRANMPHNTPKKDLLFHVFSRLSMEHADKENICYTKREIWQIDLNNHSLEKDHMKNMFFFNFKGCVPHTKKHIKDQIWPKSVPHFRKQHPQLDKTLEVVFWILWGIEEKIKETKFTSRDFHKKKLSNIWNLYDISLYWLVHGLWNNP